MSRNGGAWFSTHPLHGNYPSENPMMARFPTESFDAPAAAIAPPPQVGEFYHICMHHQSRTRCSTNSHKEYSLCEYIPVLYLRPSKEVYRRVLFPGPTINSDNHPNKRYLSSNSGWKHGTQNPESQNTTCHWLAHLIVS
jgi:hypothetical protein